MNDLDARSAISDLDEELRDSGQTVTLRRISPPVTKDILAFVRGYKASELIGGLTIGDTLVVISPSSLTSPWTGLPQVGDKVVFDNVTHSVRVADIVRVAGEVVRIDLTVR